MIQMFHQINQFSKYKDFQQILVESILQNWKFFIIPNYPIMLFKSFNYKNKCPYIKYMIKYNKKVK